MRRRVDPWRWLSRIAATGLALAALLTQAWAHEVQPSVLNLTLEDGTATLEVEATLEPFLAGVDLDGLGNTNDSARSAENDRLRRLPPADLEQALRSGWPELSRDLRLLVGDSAVPLDLAAVEVPEVGNPDLPRISTFTATADLPPGDAPVVVSWDARLGAVAIRQMGAGQDGYTGYLPQGGKSDPIPREGTEPQGWGAAFMTYVPVGYAHIVPLGLDHILFVLGLFFLAPRAGPLLSQITAFTAAHTVTLALAGLGVVSVPAAVVEPLIAASIVYVGVENVLSRGLSPWRPLIVLGFGLLHGLGFAGVLSEYGLGEANFVAKLIGFNVGVELGQLSVIAVAFILVFAALHDSDRQDADRGKAAAFMILAFGAAPGLMAALSVLSLDLDLLPVVAAAAVLLGLSGAALAAEGPQRYQRAVADPASILIALVGAYWFVERVFL